MATITIDYKGIKYRSYPESKNATHNRYSFPSGNYRKRGFESLHREVWKDANGVIPKGYQIHHKDGNTHNNSIENLEMVTTKEHGILHKGRTEKRMYAIGKAQDKAKEWHGSKEGSDWHREHYAVSLATISYKDFTCIYCEKGYKSKDYNSRFCSNKCKSAYRRKSGVDDITVICEGCKKPFKKNKYEDSRFCTRSCRYKISR